MIQFVMAAPYKNVTFNARFRAYVKFKARPAVDQTRDFGVVNVLQFDGEGGANLAADNKIYVILLMD